MGEPRQPLFLLDIHHSGYLGWGIWCGTERPERWTAETVERLERHPHYKMGLNLGAQSYAWSPAFARLIRAWLARFPDRLCITGGDYAQPTACVRTGESNLRQLLVGLQTIGETLGAPVAIWTVSEPGNWAQLPQVLNDLGYRGAMLRIHGPGQRGSLTPRADVGSVWWQGPDGSRILAVPEYTEDRTTPKAAVPYSMWIMTRYRNPRQRAGNYTLDDLWRWKELQAAKGIQPVVMSKDDDQNNQPSNNNLCMSSGHLLVADTAEDSRFRWVTAEELFAELPAPQQTLVADPNLFETRAAVFNDYGYRGNLDWLADLRAEAALALADWATVMVSPWDTQDHEPALQQAWRYHLMAQNHDLALKNSLDVSLHLQYDARRIAEGVRDAALAALATRIDTGSGAGALLVANALGWERRDWVEVDLPDDGIAALQPYLEGAPVPWEVVRRGAGRVVMGLVAQSPALGYQAYTLGPAIAPDAPPPMLAHDGETLVIDTGPYTARLSAEGELLGLWTKAGTQVAAPGSLQWIGEIGGQEVQSQGHLVSIEEHPLSVVVRRAGMVGSSHRYETTYRFVRGLPYLRLHVYFAAHYTDGDPGAPGIIGSGGRKVGLSLRLADTLGAPTCMRYQPMLVWPYDLAMDPVLGAPYWVDLSDGAAGIAWLNDGALGYRWDAAERRLDNILASGSISECSYDLALLPHDGDWLSAGVHPTGLGFGNPLHVAQTPAHPGTLPRRGQLCVVQPATVTVSSAFRQSGRNYLRLYEHAGRPAEVAVSDSRGPLQVQPVDLRLQAVPVEPALGPYCIRTLALPSQAGK